jgi:hypothetical protein
LPAAGLEFCRDTFRKLGRDEGFQVTTLHQITKDHWRIRDIGDIDFKDACVLFADDTGDLFGGGSSS